MWDLRRGRSSHRRMTPAVGPAASAFPPAPCSKATQVTNGPERVNFTLSIQFSRLGSPAGNRRWAVWPWRTWNRVSVRTGGGGVKPSGQRKPHAAGFGPTGWAGGRGGATGQGRSGTTFWACGSCQPKTTARGSARVPQRDNPAGMGPGDERRKRHVAFLRAEDGPRRPSPIVGNRRMGPRQPPHGNPPVAPSPSGKGRQHLPGKQLQRLGRAAVMEKKANWRMPKSTFARSCRITSSGVPTKPSCGANPPP